MRFIQWTADVVGKRINRERHDPTLLGTLVNPNYLSRRYLKQFVAAHAACITGKVLDFGGGEKPYRQLFSCHEYLSLEYAPALASGGIARDHSVRRRAAADVFYDGHVIPFPEQTFDAIVATEVFEHLFNLDDILKELHRVLKDDGRMLLTIPFAIHEHEVPNDFARYTSFGIQHLLERANFECVVVDRLGSYPAVIVQQLIWCLYGRARTGTAVQRLASSIGLVGVMPLNLAFHPLRPSAVNKQEHFLNLGIVAYKRPPDPVSANI